MAKSSRAAEVPALSFELWPKQQAALLAEEREVLYGGAAGPGKSHLARVAMILWATAIEGCQIYLFRRHFRDLENNMMSGPTGFRAMLAPLVQAKKCEITEAEIRFPFGNGITSRIALCHCQHDKDVFNYWGSEMHALVIEEATQFTETMIRFLRTRVRIPDAIKLPDWARKQFPRILYTSNPGGPGHAYFRRAFINAAAPDTPFVAPEEDGGMTRRFIPARLNDNPSINPIEYAKTLKGMGSPEYIRALLEGDWDAIVGAYFDAFDREKHVIDDWSPLDYPHLFKFRSYDWGSFSPFACLWIAVADSETYIQRLGKRTLVPRGSLIFYREWYGCSPMNDDVGIDLPNREMALGIKSRTIEPGVVETLTDSLPFQDRGGKTIADEFLELGVPLTKGDTSRVPGWKAMKDRLMGVEGFPTIYFARSCTHTIRTIPLLQRKLSLPEDIEDGGPDHAADAVRLACMAWSVIREAPKAPGPLVVDTSQPTFNEVIKRHVKLKKNAASSYY